MTFENELFAAISHYASTGDHWKIVRLMQSNGFDPERGCVLILPQSAGRLFAGRDLPQFVFIDVDCTDGFMAASLTAWYETRDASLAASAASHRKRPEGFKQRRQSGSGSSSSDAPSLDEWKERYRQVFEQIYAGARGAHYGSMGGGTYAKSEPFHKRVDLSGGDCVEAEARVVADNPSAPVARPERTRP